MNQDEGTTEVPMLPKGCGYMGYDFGANYLDSACYGGVVYDLDCCDDNGNLFEPSMYVPCPLCNTVEAVKMLTQEYHNNDVPNPWHEAVKRINVVREHHGKPPYVPGHRQRTTPATTEEERT